MEYRILGRTGLRVSVFGVGTWQLAGPVAVEGRPDGFPDPGRAAAVRLIRQCADLGLNVVDTAEGYGDGEGERRTGEAIRGERDRWVVATKFGIRRGPDGRRLASAAPESIPESLAGSLRRLGTDYVDLYLFHVPPERAAVERAVEILDRARRDGAIRFAGISTDDPAALDLLTELDAVDVVQLSCSLAREAGKIRHRARERRLGTMIRGALARGELAHEGPPPPLPPDDVRSRLPPSVPDDLLAELRRLRPPGLSMAAFAFRHLLDAPDVHTILIGGRTAEQYNEAVRALEAAPLDPALREAVAAARSRRGKEPRRRRSFAGRVRRWMAGALRSPRS